MSGLYTKLVANTLFPIHERLKRHTTVAVRRQLEESQWWPRETIEQRRVARLRDLLIHAATHVPYWRELFGSVQFEPERVRALDDLRRLPMLTKADIRVNAERMKSERAQGLARFNTGGSSGEPLIFFIGRERVSHDVAAKWRATRWWGVDIGDPEIVVWGSPIELGAQDRARAFRDRLLRTTLLPAFEMSEAKLDSFLATIRRVRPKMLFGYPSSLALIAEHADKRGIVMKDLGVKVAFVTSERLYDHQKEKVQRVFGCYVANGYGGRDAGFIAHECPEGGMHITAEDIIVETVRVDGSPTRLDEAGEIVITHLATRDFPFIRYRTGDVGVLEERTCPCGRGLPLLKEIQGRSTDFVVAHDGTVMHGLALIYVLRDLPGIRAFKIVQESIDRTRVLVEPAADYSESSSTAIQRGLRNRLGQAVRVDVELVERIEPEKSGKFRYVVSKVARS